MKLYSCRTSTVHEARVRRPGKAWQTLVKRAARSAMALGILAMGIAHVSLARADTIPTMVMDPGLVVTMVAIGLDQPIGIVFLGPNDFLVLEKASGQIKRVIDGEIQPTPVLDLAVNSNSERGLLSMVVHPNFPTDPSVFIRWTESTTGVDSTGVSEVPLLGNRVDRFLWNGSTLTFAQHRRKSPQAKSEISLPFLCLFQHIILISRNGVTITLCRCKASVLK